MKRKTARKAKQAGFVATVVDTAKETHDLREKLAGTIRLRTSLTVK